MYVVNPFGFGIFIGVVSTIVVEVVALLIATSNNSRGKK